MIAPGDKAVLRLAIGLGLAVLVAYGFALQMPHVVCLMATMLLCKPGPPIPPVKAVAMALLLAGLLITGVLMVPLLENYALAGVLLTGAILYALFFFGIRTGNPLTMLLVVAFTLIPVAGVAEQALVTIISVTIAVGIAVGSLVSGFSHAFFPDALAAKAAKASPPGRETASWIALRGTLVVMPVFVLALTDPSFYLAAIMKAAALGQQAGSTDTRSAGRELVGSTLMGAAMALAVWLGLSLWPSLWMLMLWMMAAALWAGARLFRVRRTRLPPVFWSDALVTMLILLGPAIEDSAGSTGVLAASAVRVCLFVGVALYAWATVWLLERWRASRSEALFFHNG
ncbi:hypothetical protein [Candidatus Accumulibacter phosphatis]|uniref:hypothetical protein n=1 Tax=Candidatus Accumulibacter phosphatis TaxID=327160 RepID=UPI0039B96A21